MHQDTFRLLPSGSVTLLPSVFAQRAALNRRYVASLTVDGLLQNHRMEAGLWAPRELAECYGGWESPTCQVRGHFLGHWLSAAARYWAKTGDQELKGGADYIVSELARCQQENGGEWAGSIPEHYLAWLARGKQVWSPQYVLHKTLMGLFDMYAVGGNQQALEVMVRWARWFSRWTGQFSRQQLDDMLDVETGGMLEVWANLYGATGEPEHLELLRRYDRPRLFEPLLRGEDVLTNQHANTTIPEAQGAARAWEVTGDTRWREIAQAYWDWAVPKRGYYVTGGQNDGEVWTPPFTLATRLGDKTQEHCTVYNMMRLAEYLIRWSGDVAYADYYERNLYNGILAQQHPQTGMISYWLPFKPGAHKVWGTPTQTFWCCHGSLVQAHAAYPDDIYFLDDAGVVLSQFIPSVAKTAFAGTPVELRLTFDQQMGQPERPNSTAIALEICAEQPTTFDLKVRMPWWLAGQAELRLDGQPLETATAPSTWLTIGRTWGHNRLHIVLPKCLTACPLPDRPDTVAFMDGPVALAGLCAGEVTLRRQSEDATSILQPHNTREWGNWQASYRTVGQSQNLIFKPLHEIVDETYTTYFPIEREPVD
jgi:hypothetical protein